ncbi:alpha/beta hydrolase [Salinibacterium sp. SYSU T00001]|uniref:alpha/beta hydrolase n=1 Tax=Homoserinimonas sedimenticola TaxID=2986805 RepID=UPI0022359A2D|nr:alpha/beta hydrolase [Salinibacterium sedimenticola]MCW4385626.1 alpha/beta hydrolase [Salinibacterium sedimenticola]
MLIHTAFAAAQAVSPELAARAALPLFRRVGPPLPVRDQERATHDAARRGSIRVRGKRVITYAWGDGSRPVLLVHGWRGRAAQFAALIRQLRAAGHSVVAFDAPANGDSPGRYADVLDYTLAIRELERRHGGFEAIIAHSFGLLSAVASVVEGADARRVVGIAGVAEPLHLLHQFGRMLRLTPETQAALRVRFERRVFPEHPGIVDRYSGLLNPLPEQVPLLLVHDRGDTVIEVEQSEQLHAAHGERSTLLLTEGLGHRRILSADVTLDAVLSFVEGADAAAPATRDDQFWAL